MSWETVIGLEVHAQLKTRTKLFSNCPVSGGSTADLAPNTFVDALTLALPGTLPVVNREAITLAIRLGLAVGSEIDPASRFARKHYFYPDLPKGYQISQYEAPICRGGSLTIGDRLVRLRRIHLEEDAGKTIHDARRGRSAVDYNRAGVPLVEIVSEPDLRSADEAVAYLRAMHRLVTWLDVCDGDMEAGNFRCDVNVSLRREGTTELGTRTEIKNVNSFRFVGLAIQSEVGRQAAILEAGGQVVQETRGFDEATGQTRSQRGKEDAHDYRYFPDPDLMVVHVARGEIDKIRSELPELPAARAARLVAELQLTPYDADLLTATRTRADFLEATVAALGDRQLGKLAANWIANDLMGLLAKEGKDLDRSPVAPDALAGLLRHLAAGTLSSKMGKDALAAMAATGVTADAWVAEHGGQVSDAALIEKVVDEVLDQSGDQVAQWLAGKDKVFGFFVGQVMKRMKGKGHPELIQATVRARLEARRGVAP
ncbi:MAG: Asp-tRNA(Asn)/Glu-tRNA(Gln) amidotransferase subunit GatB [Deltaproteobacteria bacterium]|nr:Asp-tRNA(Asn)/Glu-tRNA(Gln) amidotransferase subunit GatB [Deltaproteobacteria bacterium]